MPIDKDGYPTPQESINFAALLNQLIIDHQDSPYVSNEVIELLYNASVIHNMEYGINPADLPVSR